MKEEPISIIIPCHNSKDTITKLLDSIEESAYSNYETIVVDDASTDNSKELIKKYPVKLVELEKNKGAANARNVGAEKASNEILLFLDADTVIEKNTLSELNRFFQQNKSAVSVLGVYSKQPANKGLFPSFKALIEYSWVKDIDSCNYFMPACGAIKKKAFLEINGFDTKYKGADVEDFEFGYRLSQKHKIYLNKKIQVLHNFPTFISCIKNYYKRCFLWTRLFLKRRRFDNVGTTRSGGVSAISAFLSLLSLLLTPLSPFFSYPAIAFFALFIGLNYKFYNYARKEKSYMFMIYSIFTLYALSVVLSLAALSSILTLPFKSIGKRWTR